MGLKVAASQPLNSRKEKIEDAVTDVSKMGSSAKNLVEGIIERGSSSQLILKAALLKQKGLSEKEIVRKISQQEIEEAYEKLYSMGKFTRELAEGIVKKRLNKQLLLRSASLESQGYSKEEINESCQKNLHGRTDLELKRRLSLDLKFTLDRKRKTLVG